MKKALAICLILMLSNKLIAQHQEIIGDWKVLYEMRNDTLDAGYQEINSNPKDYFNGKKKLDSKFIINGKQYPKDKGEESKVMIWEEKGTLWIAMEDFWKVKLIYDKKDKKYYVSERWPGDKILEMKYSESDQHLLFIEVKSGIISFECEPR